jgi:two-component system response regulator PilR (NtrC family)
MGTIPLTPEYELSSRVVLVSTDQDAMAKFREVLNDSLEAVLVGTVGELAQAIEQSVVDAVLLDLDDMASTTGEAVKQLKRLRSTYPDLVIVALTRSPNRAERLEAQDAGADEFFLAPVDATELRIVVERAINKRRLEIEDRRIREELASKSTFGELIGSCQAMQRVYDSITRVAKSNSTVLLRGESGTGKELVARAIVTNSSRSNKPLISLNCGALPDNLVESELFGHEKGAFTGADVPRAGHVELADGGTLFLDEISTLGLGLQSKLLRVLEDRSVTRLGGKNPRKIDFRLIAATNDELEQMVESGRFREDLYYRINVVPIDLPPLREREQDVALLIDHFLRAYCGANDVPLKSLEPEALEVLEGYGWPGNVRELENLVQRLVLMVSDPVIRLKHLPQNVLLASTVRQEAMLIPEGGVAFDEEIKRIEVAYLQAALQRTGGRKAAAAKLLHIPPQKMKYLCRKYQRSIDDRWVKN